MKKIHSNLVAIVALLAISIFAWPVAVGANPVSVFVKGVQAQNNKIIKLINSRSKNRARDIKNKAAPGNLTASDRYTRVFNKVPAKVINYRGVDAKALRTGLSKYSGKTTVKYRIKAFDDRILVFKKWQKVIDKDIKKMRREKRIWWRSNRKYFDGRRISPATLKKLAAWVHMYGTREKIVKGKKYKYPVSLGPKTGVRIYKGTIRREEAYLRKLSQYIQGIIQHYKQARREMKSNLAKIERRMKQKAAKKAALKAKYSSKKKKYHPAPPLLTDENGM